MTFGSLFAGIGGMDLGLERAGMTCKWQVEINPFCQRVLEKHWPDVERYGDVRKLRELPYVDLICGGDPCQANSNAGRHGERAQTLGGEFLRIVGAVRPFSVLRENPSRIRADAPWPWPKFRSGLEQMGYLVFPFRLRSCCLGADHRRERLFLFAVLSDAGRPGLERAFGEILEGPDRSDSGKDIPDAAGCDRRKPAPRICRRVDGVPARVDRIKALGNAVDPAVAEWIGRRIRRAVER